MRYFIWRVARRLKAKLRTLLEMFDGKTGAAKHRIERVHQAFSQRSRAPDATWALTVLQAKNWHPRGGRSILRATAPNGHKSVVVKVYDAPGHAQKQHATLRHFANISDHVVKPRFVMPKFNVVVMQDVGHETAFTMMNEGHESKGFDICATWLKDYSADAACGIKPFNANDVVQSMTKSMRDLNAKQAEHIQPWLERTKERITAFDGLPLAHMYSFGDPTPENICISNETGKPVGIDGIRAGIRPIERDVAYLLKFCRARHWRESISRFGFVDRAPENRDAIAIERIFGDSLNWDLLNALLDMHLIILWSHCPRQRLLRASVEQQLTHPSDVRDPVESRDPSGSDTLPKRTQRT